MRLPLIGGSYTSRSIIASAQRCINLYPELNRKDALTPVTHYQRPGLRPVATIGQGPIRSLYRSSAGAGYAISGSEVYRIFWDWTTKKIGNVTANRSNPCSMIDNGFGGQVFIVDGSSNGWIIDQVGGDDVMTQLNDPTGTFVGADRVDFIDTFIVYNVPGTPFFGNTLSNTITFDPTYYYGKTDYVDNVETIIMNRHELLVIGELTSEVWYDAGTIPPLAELPGMFINHGTIAKYSVASQDISTYWLAQNREGAGQVVRHRAYKLERISNHALETAIRKMLHTTGISDAVGYCYQQDGHVFYVLHFPAGDQTWVYDESIGDPLLAWHQESWTDPSTGVLHKHRGNCHAFINGMNVVGDWQDGAIYYMDLDAYTDIVDVGRWEIPPEKAASGPVEGPTTYIRSFPHIGAARGQGTSQGAETDGRRLQFSAFRADIECGLGPTTLDGLPAQISLRWSDDRGRTFGNDVLQSNGHPGEYLTQPQWLGLGIARDRLFEISHSIAGSAALQGAWVDAEVLGT